ncbi:hypothetical protein LUZ60_017775 [Juncus effusus]|nr:hypothetical protein LUZ60_017775 [Juncus effusus]
MVGSNAEMMNTITFIIAPILALVTFLWLRKYEKGRRGKARKLPPAFTNFVKSLSPNALDDLLNEQLSKNEKIFSTRYNGEDIIISADVDLNSFSLKNEKVLFDNFFPPQVLTLLGESGLFLSASDPRYKKRKSLIVGFLHSWEIQTSFLEEVQKAADRVLSTWKHKDVVLLRDEAERVINETLRLGNVISFIPKMAKEDVDFKGFLIPKRNPIMIYLQATHLDPTIFENPQLFDPWRWQSMDKTNCFLAFGGKGVRQCNGEHIARIQIAIFLHRFFLNYKWEPVEPDHPIADPIAFPKQLPIRVYPLKHHSNES